MYQRERRNARTNNCCANDGSTDGCTYDSSTNNGASKALRSL
jgi:hypothetical protein